MNLTKYDRICRICLNESDGMHKIFGNAENNISNILVSLAGIQITENDGLPGQICTNCLCEANNACQIIIKCQESDKLLRNSLQNAFGALKNEDILQDNLDVLFDNDNCGSKLSNDFFKSEYIYDEVTETTNFVKEIFSEPIQQPSEMEPLLTDTQDENCKISKSSTGRLKQADKSTTGNVKKKACLQCSECDEFFNKKIDLKRHLSVDHVQNDGEKTHKCIECSKMYSSEHLLSIHMKTHSKLYSCVHCDKKYHRLDTFVEHQKRHSNLRTYLCSKCGKGFFNQLYLDRHIATHSKDHLEKPLYECPKCGKRMKHSNHLLVHMRSHNDRTGPMNIENENKKVILCSVCGKNCSSMSNLAVHMRRHSGKMTNFCNVCGKGYPRTTDLTIHMRQHTGEKPFFCNVCHRRFARSDKLVIHIRTHTGEKPYVCSVCGRAFAQSNDLASHKRRTVCSPPEPPTDSMNHAYATQPNVVIENQIQLTTNESQLQPPPIQHSGKFDTSANNQILFTNGRSGNDLRGLACMLSDLHVSQCKSEIQSYPINTNPKSIQHHTVTISPPDTQRLGDFQQQFPTTNILPTFTTASYK